MNTGVFLVATALAVIKMGCVPTDDSEEARNIEAIHLQHSEIWSRVNVDSIGDIYAQDFIGHFPAGVVRGPAGVAARVAAHRMAFPDWTEEVDDTIADGDRVVTRFTARGTNLGEFLGNPPTNNYVEISEGLHL